MNTQESVWHPVPLPVCQEPCKAVIGISPAPKKTQDDERLEKLSKKLLHKRQNFENSAVEEAVTFQALWLEIVDILRAQNADLDNYVKQSTYAWNKFIKRLHCAEATANIAIDKLRSRILNTAVLKEMIKIETYKAAKSLTALKEAGNEIKQASNLTEWLRFVLEVYAAGTYFAPPAESVPMVILKAADLPGPPRSYSQPNGCTTKTPSIFITTQQIPGISLRV
ncbi:unnamed protein product [Nesidiocoris tenuis]|uniref:Uncharacterized protein n=1 Tax=Nesidiocoris tenuis TaxID=355587 RepID=A0A6H5GKK9_9HEMI|nr:unnamed protein product [Nesidiocoris tenuis]